MSLIPVFKSREEVFSGEVVGRVKANRNLDFWDGNNMTNGGTGMHLGLTRLKRTIDGKRFVLIRTSQWVGSRDYGYLVDDKTAYSEAAKAGADDIIDKFFKDIDILPEWEDSSR